MYKKCLSVLALILILQSCVTKKQIQNGSVLFSKEDNSGSRTADQIKKYKVIKPFRSEINDKTETTILSETNILTNLELQSSVRTTIDQATESALVGKYYYGAATEFPNTKALKVIDSKFALQTLAIAFKVRPSLKLPDTTQSQITEAGSTFGFAPGWKLNYTWYGAKKNIFGQNFNRFSITPGIVFGFGTADLKKGTSSKTLDKTEPIFTSGGYLMIGFNNVNIGFVLGNDRSIGKAGQDWYYNKRWWRGIAVGLDLIK